MDPASARRMRPTRALAGLGLILAAMALAAANYQSNGAWLILFLTASLVGNSAIQTWRNLNGLTLAIDAPPLQPAETPGQLAVRLESSAPRFGIRIAVAEAVDPPLRSFAPAQDLPEVVALPARPRGIYPITHLRLQTTWPFGLFIAERRLPVDLTLVVHPLPQGQPWEARHGAGRSGEPVDYAGVRPWQAGDHPRHIDWRAAARREDQAPPVKTFTGGGTLAAWVDWEHTEDLGTEARLGQLARWVLELHQAGRAFGLRLPGGELPPGAGPGHLRRCLTALAAFGRPDQTPQAGDGAGR